MAHRIIDSSVGAGGVGKAITKDDDDTFNPTRAVWVGTGGDVAVTFAVGDTPVVIKNVQDGTLLPLAVIQIRSTSTTASDFVIIY